ncbi:MAG: DUF3800 domain-containing protein [Candidatus Saccharibacteria bacterium]|nr:DUF3800 domain-containing protein [Candidatus Saccharibacteria bacterium]
MSELSVFIDESGDFGEYTPKSPYYLISVVFHDQAEDITGVISNFENSLDTFGLAKDFYVHVGPAIRREEPFGSMDIRKRRKIVGKLVAFSRNVDFMNYTFEVEKKHFYTSSDIIENFEKIIKNFIRDNLRFFVKYDTIKIYYDRGQKEVSKIIRETFVKELSNASMKKDVDPAKYKMAQVADLVCTLELTRRKAKRHELSKSEIGFFGSKFRDIDKNYFIPVLKKKHFKV